MSRPQLSDADVSIIDQNILNLPGAGLRMNLLTNINSKLNDTVEDIMNHEYLLNFTFDYVYRKGFTTVITEPLHASVFTKKVDDQGFYLAADF